MSQWAKDAAAPFEGWDFSYLNQRMVEGEPPWDYAALARGACQHAQNILDVATGGGEALAALAPFAGRVTAVEGYPPNIEVARRRLGPLRIEVFKGNTASGMPFGDATFDLVLNRHGGFRPAEMHRILQPGGTYLTQQVAGDNLADLAEAFGTGQAYPQNTLDRVSEQMLALGFTLRRAENWRGTVSFLDVGAIVYFLKAIPWVVQGFDLETHRPHLMALDEQRKSGRPLVFSYTRFLIEAVKS